MTLKDVATKILTIEAHDRHTEEVAAGNRAEGLYVEAAETEAELTKLINNISRIETGVRGLKSDVAVNLASALGFDVRELERAPLGYHLSNAQLTSVDLSEPPENPKPAFNRVIAEINVDPANLPKEWLDGHFHASLIYLPVKTATGFAPLSDTERLELVLAGLNHHFSYNAQECNRTAPDALKFPEHGGLQNLTQSDMKLKAEELVKTIDWDSITERGESLFAFCLTKLEGDQVEVRLGFATDAQWFRTGVEKVKYASATAAIDVGASAKAEAIKDEVGSSAHPTPPATMTTPKIPVLGFAQGGYDMEFVDNGDPFEEIETPPFLARIPQAFAVIVANDSMEPRYEPGDYLYCHPNKQPRRGDYVVAALTGQRAVVKRFIRRTPDSLILEQLNPAEEIVVPSDEVQSVFVIAGTKTV